MIVECEQCGAPLQVVDAQRFATCNYCHTSNRVESLRTMAPQTPPDWAPPQRWQPPPHRRHAKIATDLPYRDVPVPAPPQTVTGTTAVGAAVGVVAVLLGLGVAGAVAFMVRGGHVGTLIAGLDPTAPPVFGTLDLGTLPLTLNTFTGTASGSVAAERLQTACRGYVHSQPDLVVRLVTPRSLSLTTASSADLTMVVRDANGSVRCDDDSGEGSNPLIAGAFAPGVYGIWIGTFSQGRTAPFTLQVRSELLQGNVLPNGLAPETPPAFGAIDLDHGPSSRVLRGSVSAGIDLTHIVPGCSGWVSAAPSATVQTTSARSVVFDVTGSSGVLLRDPQGNLRCVHGSDVVTPGVTQVWVAVPSSTATRGASVVALSLSSQVGGAEPTVEGLAPDAEPTMGVLDLDALPLSFSRSGQVLGHLDASALGGQCRGWIPIVPDVTLVLREAQEVDLRGDSATDTVMVLRSPNGEIACDDDSGGASNPRIHRVLQPGTHAVWIGSYSSGQDGAFALHVTHHRTASGH